MDLLIEVVGWAGAALILTAYALLSLGKLMGRSRAYQLLNVIGSAGFVVNGAYHGAIPSATLNAVWLAIGGATLVRLRTPPAAAVVAIAPDAS